MSETTSADERGEELFRVLCLKDTIHILRHLKEHDEVQFTQFAEFVNPVTLQRRLGQLLRLTLIEHHLERENVRREWYEFTEKGRKVLQILEDIIKVVEDEEHISLANIYKNIGNSGGAQGDLMVDNDRTRTIEYYLEKEESWNYYKECTIAQVAEPPLDCRWSNSEKDTSRVGSWLLKKSD